MRILITGASGFIGKAVASRLAAHGHRLVPISRHPPDTSAENFVWRRLDFADAVNKADWRPLLGNIDAVINCVGIFKQRGAQSFEALHSAAPIALFEAASEAGVQRIVQISALGPQAGAKSPYHQSKLRADEALARMSTDWVILRPSLIVGADGVSWRMFQALAAQPVIPVIGDGKQIVQPIALDDVAEAVVRAVERPEAVGRRIDLVGADEMTLQAYLRRIAHWLGRSHPHTMLIPYAMAQTFAGLIGRLTGAPMNRDAIAMLRAARSYSGQTCREALGFTPKGIGQWLDAHPAGGSKQQAARLYFLRPLLRLSLAFMWIAAGVSSAFFYPAGQGLALLGELGLSGMIGKAALYGSAALDLILGLMLLVNWRVRLAGLLQLLLMLFYTAALTLVAPEMWADAFGPLAKNIPIFAATLVMLALETEKQGR